MKKLFSLILCVALLCVSLCSCSGPNADMTEENITETVDLTITALKEFDTEALKKYVDSSTLSYIISYAEQKQQFVDLGKAIFANLEIEIQSIDTQNATVTLSVKNKDLADAAAEFTQELTSQYSGVQLLSKLKNDSFLDLYLKSLCEKIDACEMQSYPIEITLNIKQEKKNLVLCFDETAEDAVSGGALSAIKSVV
ncbi:MAG: hypothetical protein ACI4IQ_06925 [Eubacterium sp.]